MKKKSVPRNGIKEIQGEIKEIICKENEKKNQLLLYSFRGAVLWCRWKEINRIIFRG
jgi:hypothetical protein